MVMVVAAIALLALVAASGPDRPATERLISSEIARKQRCAVRYPDPCWRDPLAEAYGRELAGAVRALAPAPRPLVGPGGERVVGVDYRRCKQARCAVPAAGERGAHLTASNRRTAAYTSVDERGATTTIDYWVYRPSLGWEQISRTLSAAEIDDLAPTRLLDDLDPKLIPLETLLGRDETRFPPTEEPPWRNRIESRWGDPR